MDIESHCNNTCVSSKQEISNLASYTCSMESIQESLKKFIAGVCLHLLDVEIESVLSTPESDKLLNSFLSRTDTMALYVETTRDSNSSGKNERLCKFCIKICLQCL